MGPFLLKNRPPHWITLGSRQTITVTSEAGAAPSLIANSDGKLDVFIAIGWIQCAHEPASLLRALLPWGPALPPLAKSAGRPSIRLTGAGESRGRGANSTRRSTARRAGSCAIAGGTRPSPR